MDARCRCGRRFSIPKVEAAAQTRACHSCGAAVSSTAASCPYCASPVAQQRCPRCFEIVAAGGRYCQSCGTNVAAAAVEMTAGEPRDAACPRCASSKLEALLIDGVALDRCLGCGGLWLDHRVFAHLQRNEASNAPMMARISQLPQPGATARRRHYIPCPECKSLMVQRNFAGCSGVIIDECRAHGVWFDAGELASIMQFIRDGGLDKARARREQRMQEEQSLKDYRTMLDRARVSAQASQEARGDDRSLTVLNEFLDAITFLF